MLRRPMGKWITLCLVRLPGWRASKRLPVESTESSGGMSRPSVFAEPPWACDACHPDLSKRTLNQVACPTEADFRFVRKATQDAGGDAWRRSGPTTLFVIGHSTRLIAYARFKGSLWNGFSRTGLRKHIVECTNTSLRGVLDGVKRALSERIVLKL
jgi:hypothetical protein